MIVSTDFRFFILSSLGASLADGENQVPCTHLESPKAKMPLHVTRASSTRERHPFYKATNDRVPECTGYGQAKPLCCMKRNPYTLILNCKIKTIRLFCISVRFHGSDVIVLTISLYLQYKHNRTKYINQHILHLAHSRCRLTNK